MKRISQMYSSYLPLKIAGAALLLASSSVQAQIIVDHRFDSLSLTAPDADKKEIIWRTISPTGSAPILQRDTATSGTSAEPYLPGASRMRLAPNSGSPRGTFGALYADAAGTPAGGLTQSSVDLLAIGDKISLRVDLGYNNDEASFVDNTLRIGLFSSNGSRSLAAINTSSSTDTSGRNDYGYFATVGVRTATTPTISEDGGTNSGPTAGSDVALLTATGTTTNGAVDNRVKQTLEFTLERTAFGVDINFTLMMGATLLAQASASDTATVKTSFDEIVFMHGGGGATELRADNIVLEFIPAPVPEPSAFTFLGLAGMVAMMMRRRNSTAW